MLDERLEEKGKAVVNAAFKVHQTLGPGLLEKIYEICMTHELRKAGFYVERQKPVEVVYDGIVFEEGFRVDLLVEDAVIMELKAVDTVNAVWQAQLISHLKLGRKKLGYLINFNIPLIREGIKRFVNTPTVPDI